MGERGVSSIAGVGLSSAMMCCFVCDGVQTIALRSKSKMSIKSEGQQTPAAGSRR